MLLSIVTNKRVKSALLLMKYWGVKNHIHFVVQVPAGPYLGFKSNFRFVCALFWKGGNQASNQIAFTYFWGPEDAVGFLVGLSQVKYSSVLKTYFECTVAFKFPIVSTLLRESETLYFEMFSCQVCMWKTVT